MAPIFERIVEQLAARHQRLIGAAIARMIVGTAGLHYYLSGYAHRRFLWGPQSPFRPNPTADGLQAALPAVLLPSASLYSLVPGDAGFEIRFHAGIAVAVLFTLLGGRVLTVIHLLLITSLYGRNVLLPDGGDNLARVLLLFLCVARTDAYFSPGAAARRSTLRSRPTPSLDVLGHNVGLLLCVFQVCVTYFGASLWKLSGQSWTGGSAVYYATRIEQFHFLPQLDWITARSIPAAIVAYAVVAFQLCYPFLILARRTRRMAVALAVCLHVAIALKMGLVSFSLVMIGVNALVLTDEDYRGTRRRPSPATGHIG